MTNINAGLEISYVEESFPIATHPRAVCLDFDGVLHDYTPPYKPALITGKPVDGAANFVGWLNGNGFFVIVHSVRTATAEGRIAVSRWLISHKIYVDFVACSKPYALYYIDDNAFRFKGKFSNKLKRRLIDARDQVAGVSVDK